jgi:hypothetical protein
LASIDDVNRDVDMLLDALVRTPPDGMTGGMGQVGSFPGLVPRTYRAALKARDAAAEILSVVGETNGLLKAVNVETLGRIEALGSGTEQSLGRVETAVNDGRAAHDQALGRIESELKQVMEFLPTVRADVADLSAKLDGVLGELRLGLADLNGKVVALQADVNALPR